MTTPAIAWKSMEDAIAAWVRSSTDIPGDRVRVQISRDQGEARGPAPKAVISLVSLERLSVPDEQLIPRVMQQRCTVIASGPGEVGIDFYPGFSGTPQRISITAGIGDLPAVSAAALLAELIAELPAGYTASADPMDTASVLVDGTDGEPLFESVTADALLLTVATVIPRHIALIMTRYNLVFRVSFRSDSVSGSTLAANSLGQCETTRPRYLDIQMRRLGFETAGTALSTSTVDVTRRQSTAFLDVRYRGPMTAAMATKAMRITGVTLAAA